MADPARQQYLTLSDEEEQWLTEAREALVDLVGDDAADDEDLTLPQAADQILASWRDTPEDERPDINVVATICAVALGDALIGVMKDELALEWMIVKDDDGQDLCLRAGTCDLTLYPTHTVAKHIGDERPELISNLFVSLIQASRDVKDKIDESRGEDSDPFPQPPGG